MNLVRMIDFWARYKPESPAIIMLDSVISYSSLSRAIRSAAGYLARARLDPNAPVGVLIDHPPRNIVIDLALMSLGVPAMVVRENQVQFLKAIGAKTLLHDGQGSAIPGMERVQIGPAWFADANPAPPTPLGVTTRTKLSFTSGTTGIPKAISFSDADIAARSTFRRIALGDTPWSRSLIMPGLSTNFAHGQVALAFEVGKTISFAATAEDISRLIDFFGIDMLICSTQQAQGLADHLEARKHRLQSLKCIYIGGAVITESLALKVRDYLCRNIFGTYASTEAHVAAFGHWDVMKHTPRAAGFLCPWTTLECVDASGAVLPPGQEGEIRLKTPNQGLLYAPGQEPEDQIETWFYPGDRGFVTAENLLVVTGRTADTINRGGVKVSAAIVDQCLASLPGIADAAVCVVPGEAGPDELIAIVVSKAPADPRSLNAALDRADIDAKIDRVVAVDGIPRNAMGKVNRDDLRTLARRLTS